MRIGIDATALPSKPVGAGHYIIQLIRALDGLDHEHEIIVFAQETGRMLIETTEMSRTHWQVFPNRSPAHRLIWEQTALPVHVRKARLDVFHGLHYTRPLFLPGRSLVTFHDMTFFLMPERHTRSKRLLFPAMMRISARQADHLIADSESTRQDMLRLLRIDPQKVTTISLGVSKKFRPIHHPGLLEDVRQKYHLPRNFILHVGTVEPRKNLPLLIRSYRRVVAALAQAPDLVLVGRPGWKVEEVHRQIKNLVLEDRVHFTGYVPDYDLPIVYNLAGLFVYPSAYEGFGLPPLEGLACGKPVITTAISSMPEHIGDAGVLVPPNDEIALSEAMLAVLRDPDLRQRLQKAGPQQAAGFTWKRTAQQTLAVYEEHFGG